jgi:hypothetical protein
MLNAEFINDRTKLLYHRLVARRIRHDPNLIEQARTALKLPPFAGSKTANAVRWCRLLDGPIGLIIDGLISRSAEARQLRLDSPFPFVEALKIDDVRFRRRLWRAAKRASKRVSRTLAE